MNAKVILVLRILLGLIYTVFGFNFFFHFIPMPPMPGDGGVFLGIFAGSGWMTIVKILEIAGGIALLSNQYSRLAVIVLMPITVNILLFHTLVSFAPVMGAVMLVINAALIYAYKEDFKGALKKS